MLCPTQAGTEFPMRWHLTLLSSFLLALLACSGGDSLSPPRDAVSADYGFEPSGGRAWYPALDFWVDSAVFTVMLDGNPVRDVPVRYRVTLGEIEPVADTTDASGRTHYVWRILIVPSIYGDTGEVFG